MAPVHPRPFDRGRDSVATRDVERETRAFMERTACDDVRREEGLERPDSLLSDRERSAKWRIAFTCANAVRVERWRRMEGGQVFYSASAGRAAARSMAPDFDATGALAAHGCPVRAIVGDQDWVVGGGPLIHHLYGGIHGVKVRILENAGHALWLDAPERFAEALDAALREVTTC